MGRKECEIQEVFLHNKPVKILLGIREISGGEKVYASHLSKYADCTYAHTVKILDMFKTAGLVTFDKKGRVKYIKLTTLGESVVDDFESLNKKFLKICAK